MPDRDPQNPQYFWAHILLRNPQKLLSFETCGRYCETVTRLLDEGLHLGLDFRVVHFRNGRMEEV